MMKIPGTNPHIAPELEFNCTELELHAFVDGELDTLERTHVLKTVQQSASIRAKLNALEQIKSLVLHSYANIRYPH
jgi:anti-sigma factor RsiW